MIMFQTAALQVRKVSEVRTNWSEYYDQAVREKPLPITKNRDLAFLLSLKDLATILQNSTFSVEYEVEDGYFAGKLREIDIVEGGESYEEMIHNLAKGLVEYATDYFDQDFYRAMNRNAHLPFVLHVLIQEDLEGVKKLIRA